jgi:hypothetical protein
LGGIKLNENWRKRYNKDLMQFLGDLDILSIVIISRFNWSGHANIMDRKSKSSILKKSSGKSAKKTTKKTDNVTLYKQILVSPLSRVLLEKLTGS